MGSARIKSVRQRLAFDIDTGYDEVMTDAAELKSSRNLQQAYDPKTKRYTEKGRKFCKNCDPVSQSLFKKLGGADKGYNIISGIFEHDPGVGRTHRWVRDDQGTIYDASREQFGDTPTIHKINPRDPKYKNYTEQQVLEGNSPLDSSERLRELGLNNNKRTRRYNRRYDKRKDEGFDPKTGGYKPLHTKKRITKGVKAIFGKSARIQTARQRLADIFDVIEGGSVERIKRQPNIWSGASTGNPGQTVRMSPKKYLDLMTSTGLDFEHMINTPDPKKWMHNSGSISDLGTRGDNYTPPNTYEGDEIFRGDESGDSTEYYKRLLRRGEGFERPWFNLNDKGEIMQEGKHRARALMEEDYKDIPVTIYSDEKVPPLSKIGDVDSLVKKRADLKVNEALTGNKITIPRKDKRYPILGRYSKSARIQMARERLGAIGKVDWETLLKEQTVFSKLEDGTGDWHTFSGNADFISSKGEIIGRGNWKGIPERSGDATHFQQITNMGFNPHHVDLKGDLYDQKRKVDFTIDDFMKETNSVRARGTKDYINIDSNHPLTNPQIKTINNHIQQYKIPVEKTLVADYTPNKVLRKQLGLPSVKKIERQTHTKNIIGEPLTEKQLRESKLRQRIGVISPIYKNFRNRYKKIPVTNEQRYVWSTTVAEERVIPKDKFPTMTDLQKKLHKRQMDDSDPETGVPYPLDFHEEPMYITQENATSYAKLRQRIAEIGRPKQFNFKETLNKHWKLAAKDPRFKAFTHSSSFVGNVKYDQDEQSMQIILNGKTYDFCNVEERLFDSFSGAGSKGAFFNREIKSLHNCGAW